MTRTIELPMFDVFDAMGWIISVQTSTEVKIKLAHLSMKGRTIHWSNLLRATEDDLTWEKLKLALIALYGGCKFENPF